MTEYALGGDEPTLAQEAAWVRRELSAALTSARNLERSRRIALEESDRLRKRVHDLESASWADAVQEAAALRERAATAELALARSERRVAEIEARS